MAKDGIIRLNNGTFAVETKVEYLVCGGQHEAPLIDSYFTTAQTALIGTDKEHIKEPQRIIEWIQDKTDVCRKQVNQLDDFLHTLIQNRKNQQYKASLLCTPESDKSKNPAKRHTAYHRARNTIEKMLTEKQLFQKLKDIFGDYQRRGFISLKTTYSYKDDKCSCLLWHAVYKNYSTHTKVRVVFDASCRDKRLRTSLNNFVWIRPSLTNSLVEILLQFRLQRFALTADI